MSDATDRNCWTCGWDRTGYPHQCYLLGMAADGLVDLRVEQWVFDIEEEWGGLDDEHMPPRDTPQCPGWKSRQPATTGGLFPSCGPSLGAKR